MAEFDFHGMDLVHPINRIRNGLVALAQNVRAYLKGAFTLRNFLSGALYTLAAAVHTISRINDSTPNGPADGYSILNGAGSVLTIWNTTIGGNGLNVATGLSGNPMSFVPFRPNTSVQPWMYWGDSAPAGNVTLATKYLISGSSVNFVSSGMGKTRSDGLTYKMGIKEPQLAPVVSTQNSNITTTGTLEATAIPWTNYLGANSSYDYGETNGYPHPPSGRDGTPPFIVNVENASFITINSITGTATINGNSSATPTTSGPVTSTYPAYFIQEAGTGDTPPVSATVVTGAFTDGSGNVIPMGVAPLFFPSVVDVGAVIGTPNGIQVPYGAQSFQIGIDSAGNTFNSNSGSFAISITVTTYALPTVTSILGSLIAYYFGDSPSSGPVSSYIWKNPDDPSGSGPTRSISSANGNTTGNSFIFDATFTSGIPALPGIGNGSLPMTWTLLSPESAVTGSNVVFAAPLVTTYPTQTTFTNFNFCLVGNIYFPASGYYTLVLTSHDDCIWGIGGGVRSVSATAVNSGGSVATALSGFGQTVTVANGLPLLPRGNDTGSNDSSYQATTVVVSVPNAGIYPIEIDYDYWSKENRILLLDASPTASASPTPGAVSPFIIPPLPANVRQQVQYRYVYRSSATGAVSNPSPASAAETVPVTANTITSVWSNDPQVDVVDYYRIDSVVSSFTYVNTGPNDNSGGGTNTPVTDSLLDTDLGTQLLDYDNFEPFPSIDLPQKGVCDVSGGVITWISGGAIGGTQVGFNVRWLAGTTILIGSPTSLAYVMIARPTPAGFQNSYTYPLGFVILDPSNHYQQVTVSGTSQATGTPSWNDSGGTTVSGGVTFQDRSTIFNGDGYVTQITIPGVPDGNNLAYQIAEPILAAQPLPYLWGPSDNIPFTLGCGDPLRPGTLYWCSGSNLDSAPDTNQFDLTDPSEALVNGLLTGGRSIVFTIRRAIAVMPNFFNALATVTGTQGSTWSVETTEIDRGLFMPRCLAVDGSGLIFFRVDDGIHVSNDGLASQSITDEDLYNLFPHEGSTPVEIYRNGIYIYPPDDTLPELQRFSIQNGYLYYDYNGINGEPNTLVYDIGAKGWITDVTTPPTTIHAPNEGQSIQGILAGCNDGTVRQFETFGTEVATGTVLSPAVGGVGWQHIYEVTIEYSSNRTITLSFVAADTGNGSYAPSALTLSSTNGSPTKYTTKVSANKFKWLQLQFQSADPTLQIYLEGCAVEMKDWGSTGKYNTVPMFAPAGGEGGQT